MPSEYNISYGIVFNKTSLRFILLRNYDRSEKLLLNSKPFGQKFSMLQQWIKESTF